MKKNHCSIHGEINLENAYACKNPNGTIRLRCKQCAHARRINYYASNRDQAIKDAAKWKKDNREHVNENTKQDRINNPEKYARWSAAQRAREGLNRTALEVCRRRGLDRNDYFQMIEDQNDRCAICLQEETRMINGKITRLCIDHDHKTNKVRQLLCHACNTAIGKFKDDTNLLQSAIDYLKKHAT